MEMNFQRLMTKKSDKELEEYLNNIRHIVVTLWKLRFKN